RERPAHRLPPATRVGPVRLAIADLGRSLAFYQEILGLRLLETDGERAILGAGAGEGPLVVLQQRRDARPVPRPGRLGLYHYAILLPERAALGRCLLHLHRSGVRVATADHRVSEALYLSDPDGLGIELYADRPRSTWGTRPTPAGPELVLTTEALDLESLGRAAGATEWAGLPGGTVIGHVHLHVGSLPEAAAFYHETLGLDLTVWSYPGALFLSAGGYHHHLGLNTWIGPTAEAPRPDEARLLEWTLLVPDRAAALEGAGRLRAAGYQVELRAEDPPLACDPWGTAVRLDWNGD
ncbi:MAG TPA: VOC family protein, partial [Gemmatimonadales bacterium]|nr:VOC family protein [Gemmatimonadales bacterium]